MIRIEWGFAAIAQQPPGLAVSSLMPLLGQASEKILAKVAAGAMPTLNRVPSGEKGLISLEPTLPTLSCAGPARG